MAAQTATGEAPATDSAVVVPCEGDTVRAIVIRPQRPPFAGHMRIWRKIARSVGLHHATTREGVIRRYVTLHVGRPCTEFRRAESERLLRAQPFLSSAEVRTVADVRGGVRVEVTTVDEVPAIFDARLRRGQPAAIGAGNENVFGLGVHVEARVERGFAYRNGYGGTLVHHHFLGRPYLLRLDGQRDPIGEHWDVSAAHPFLTDLQRIAWHVGASHSHRYGPLTRGRDSYLALGVDRDFWDVGGVLRFGPPGQLWLLGGIATGERTTPERDPIMITEEGMVTVAPSGTRMPYEPRRSVRLNVVTGIRALDFVPARGFDALRATQDIARGLQVGLIAGHGLPTQGDDDLFFAGNVFGGIGSSTSYAGVQLDGEARYDNERHDWDGVIGSGRAAWYLKPHPSWTTITSVEGAGGWRVRLPFHLRLDDREGGMHVRTEDQYLGTGRLVGRVEQRWNGGSFGRRGDLGLGAFAEVGRLWSGEAPFGEGIAQQTAIGFSILGAFPAGAQRLARLDIAFPISGPAKRTVAVRFSLRNWTRAFWEEPDDIGRARAGALLADIFSWP